MIDPFQMKPELRYGAPPCDQLLVGREFTIGYSWYFRLAKWTLEIVNRTAFNVSDLDDVERLDNFRADMRLPKRFRASLSAYQNSGYHRGHLVASANMDLTDIFNSETFLLSNMAPQVGSFNTGKWKSLEKAIRELDARDDVFETYVLTCPLFYFERPIEWLGKIDEFGIIVPVPHAFVKSVMIEKKNGHLEHWTFLMENKKLEGDLSEYLVKTHYAEQLVGGRFWSGIDWEYLDKQKSTVRNMW